jgi:dihydrofolate reductase
MRKLIVSNMVTVDGFYEGKNRSLGDLFEHLHPSYAGDDGFDRYNLERLEAAGTMLFSGRESFQGFRDYWWNRENLPEATPVRREIARKMNPMEKIVVSDRIRPEELAPWNDAQILRRADAREGIASLKGREGKDILIFVGRMLWNELMRQGLVDELHLAIFPLIGGEGTKLFDQRPDASLRLIEARMFSCSGVLFARYAVCPPGE